jgi:hypothetical protein
MMYHFLLFHWSQCSVIVYDQGLCNWELSRVTKTESWRGGCLGGVLKVWVVWGECHDLL